jgi:hypothetical protein
LLQRFLIFLMYHFPVATDVTADKDVTGKN